jgi:hypothetical protein
MSYIGDKNVDLEISLGNVGGYSVINKFGRNSNLALNTPEVVWSLGTTPYPWQAAATAVDVQSTSPNDDGDPAGTGAWTLKVSGLDASFVEQEETVTLNGVGAVRLSGTWIRIYRMEVIRAGSNLSNVGVISAVTSPGAVTIAEIPADVGQTLMAVYTVPSAKYAVLQAAWIRMRAATAAATSIDFEIYIRENADDDGAFTAREIGSLTNTATSEVYRPYTVNERITGPADMYIIATSNKAAASVDAGFDLILVDV